jgi:hypothetical protein
MKLLLLGLVAFTVIRVFLALPEERPAFAYFGAGRSGG